MQVPNTRAELPRVTLFGRLNDGNYVAEVMAETSVPYTPYWKNEIEQVVVYLDPNDQQLQQIVSALNEGRLNYNELQNYGSANGGESNLPI